MAPFGRQVRGLLTIGWKYWLAVAGGFAFAAIYELAVHWLGA